MRTQLLCRYAPRPARTLLAALAAVSLCALTRVGVRAAEPPVQAEVKSIAVNGELNDEKARLVIQADLKGLREGRERPLYATTAQQLLRLTREKLTGTLALKFEMLQGEAKEIALTLSGDGEVRKVTGPGLRDWSIRQETNGVRTLVLRLEKSEKPATVITCTVETETLLEELPRTVTPLALALLPPALFSGFVRVDYPPELEVTAIKPTGLAPVDPKFLPEGMTAATKAGEPEPLAFRFQGSAYALPLELKLADPEGGRVVLRDFRLLGKLSDKAAAFTLAANARVRNPKGGVLELLSGRVALTERTPGADWRLKTEQGRFILVFDHPGEFPVQIQFNAAVQAAEGWNNVDFQVAPSALQPLSLQGLAADTQFRFPGAARPTRAGEDFATFLPASGQVKLAWRQARKEAEGRLFYAAELLSQIVISPGLMAQTALLEGKVLQGEMDRVTLVLRGAGEVTRVQGEQVLAWSLEPGASAAERRLVVKFNQPQKDRFMVQLQVQTPLGAFPQAFEPVQARPEGASRFAGYHRILNEGAVRLEVLKASGLAQLSPEQFPESEATKALGGGQASQRFVFRFSGAQYQLSVQADNVLPELAVSEVLVYHLGDAELAIEAEIELDVREAPLRESTLRVPKGFAVARLTAANLSDYFLKDDPSQEQAELRVVYGQPVSGRQLLQLRLERNKPLGEPVWVLPRLELVKAKSVRGHVGVSADAGFRLSPTASEGLTEIATAFFPRKLAGIQAAFRLSEPGWQASLRVERLPQSVQADAFHLFSIGEGVAYGSSVINYVISGAPMARFKLELSAEYFNVEFTGKDLRNWRKTEAGFEVELHTPVSGACTLLATYERPFKAQGETLSFTGARPLDAQSEQGHTLVVSAYQFQVRPATVSAGLLPLEPGEVPPEYRLFFDTPVLAAYRYTARPFNLQLALSPLAQGETLSQVVDRAFLTTHISKEGAVLTEARYFLKNRGTPNLRLVQPEAGRLWSVSVNGAPVVPVTAGDANLIPLPQRADPSAVISVELKLATRAQDPRRVTVVAPVISAPVLLANWLVAPDTGQRLVFRGGTIRPATAPPEASALVALLRLLRGEERWRAWLWLGVGLVSLGLAVLVWRVTARSGTYRLSARHLSGALVGLAAFSLAATAVIKLVGLIEFQPAPPPTELRFLAPVQATGAPLRVEVGNVPIVPSAAAQVAHAWPVIAALVLMAYALGTSRRWFRPVGLGLGWTLLAYGVLRWDDGVLGLLVVLLAFLTLQVLVPAGRALSRLPAKPSPPPPPPATGAAPVAATLALGGLLGLLWQPSAQAAPGAGTAAPEPPVAESVIQQIRVVEGYAFGSVKVRWAARQGQRLPLLYEPAVLTRVAYPTNALRLIDMVADGRRAHRLWAQQEGTFEAEFEYQVQVTKKEAESGFVLPTQFGLINRATLTLAELDVEVASPQAVAVLPEAAAGKDTVATLVLPPANDPWLGWRPRSRDTRQEKAIYYVEVAHLYVPAAGVIEGEHLLEIKPAQGELSELTITVPAGATITDVVDPAKPGKTDSPPPAAGAPTRMIVSSWRFDPDTRNLRVSLNPPQARPFGIVVRSQNATGPLPFEQTVGLLALRGAVGQFGLLGVATGGDVQLETVKADAFSPINLEDFPASLLARLVAQTPGLTLRRAYRYTDPAASAALKAAAVEPDVRVEAQQTLSLGEDRSVLAANLTVEVLRAGIFRLSFVLPPGLDVEAISGAALSHWTELKTPDGRIITLHLRGRTEGKQQFAINLAGPGAKAQKAWTVPRFLLREASKQQGQLLLAPEQGLRLQVASREGATQLDPQAAGIRQPGVLAFRLLHGQWSLALDIEQVAPWVQVTGLQHVTVNEAQVKTAANLQYQIENAGLKSFRVRVPAKADSVRFRGEQVADFLPRAEGEDGMQEWEVKLHRRVIGTYLLQVSYQMLTPATAKEVAILGVQALGVNLQRGFLTLQSGGRLQVQAGTVPPALQATEWQSIPRALRQDLQAASANLTFRLVEPAFRLPLKVDRLEATKLLPARVNSVALTSVVSDAGVMLTQVRLEMAPGDKRLLHLKLPAAARFWFAFVNQNGVWPWRENGQILLPLEQPSKTGQSMTVELFYSNQAGAPGSRSLKLELLGPQFDLPLENITWQVYLGEKWRVTDWTGSLQLRDQEVVAQPLVLDLDAYLQGEESLQKEKTKEAEGLLQMGNTLLDRGDPQQARRAFQAAYGLSQHDDAFNEDARVQLHNLKTQQAVLGLNVLQAPAAGEAAAQTAPLRQLREGKTPAYTQQQAKEILGRNKADENAAFTRLAERLIQQQDAAVSNPSAIRAAVPKQGRMLTFARAMQVDGWVDLKLGLAAKVVKPTPTGAILLLLGAGFILAVLFAWAARGLSPRREDPPA